MSSYYYLVTVSTSYKHGGISGREVVWRGETVDVDAEDSDYLTAYTEAYNAYKEVIDSVLAEDWQCRGFGERRDVEHWVNLCTKNVHLWGREENDYTEPGTCQVLKSIKFD